MGDESTRNEVAAKPELPAETTPEEQAPAPLPNEGEDVSDSIFGEFMLFLREEKKYWLAPVVLVLLALAGILAFAEGSAIAPFIYTIF